MTSDTILRQQLVKLLLEGQAHMTFDEAIANFSEAHFNSRAPNVTYTFWHLLDHIRICQWDILDYCRNADYKELKFPDDLWQPAPATTNTEGWQKTIAEFRADRQALVDLVQNPATDLTAQIPHGYAGHNILREILVVADHNAYHVGEFAILRQTMQLW
jgi:hypothetical protein